MRIENHRLVACAGYAPEFQLDDHGAALVPEIAVIHYAVTEHAGATAAVLKARDYVSCHVTVDSQARVIQQVPFNRMAYHAGASTYRGRSNVNRFSLGIEISNPGPLVRRDGALFTTYGKRWTGPAIEARHASGKAPPTWTHWAEYSTAELDLCAQIVALWRDAYGIVDVVGHDGISPGRKFDPGPAFPLDWLRRVVFFGGGGDV